MRISTESYEDYLALLEWAKDQHITFFDGHTVCLLDAVYEGISKEAFSKYPYPYVANLRFLYEEAYFYRNCHIPFVQDALAEFRRDYSNIDPVAPPCPDVFRKGRDIKIEPYPEFSENNWVISSEGSCYGYNEYYNTWMHRDIPYPTYGTSCNARTLEEVNSILSNQYLHSGAKFKLSGMYVGEDYDITVL